MSRVRFVAVVLIPLVCGCGRSSAPSPAASSSDAAGTTDAPSIASVPQRVEAKHLPNAWRLHERVISGGLPEGEAGFQELRSLGVKTVISVDGATPDVALAKKHGLRYVHLPHGYDGIPAERGRELAKAVRNLPGTVYIHCHHGKHRSPAAATVACVALGLVPPAEAGTVLKTAGTSANYRGLHQSAEEARPIDPAVLDSFEVEFRETAPIPPMAEAMVAVEHAHDHLKTLEKSGWKKSATHPDLDPPHEALLLREHFTELMRTEDVQGRTEGFRKLLREGEEAAAALEEALREAPPSTERATTLLKRVTANCGECHRTYRDVPLREKPQ